MLGYKTDAQRARQKKRGGRIVGPGTGTSDSIKKDVQDGSYIMPADSTEAIGEQALAGMGGDVPVNVSNGEYEMPPEQVHAVGAQVLDQMRDATHEPVQQPQQQQGLGYEPELFFADGGVVDERLRRNTVYVDQSGNAGRGVMPSSSRQMVVANPAASAPPTPQLGAPQPQLSLPAPEAQPQARGYREPDYRAIAETKARAKRDTANYMAERDAQDARAAQPAAKQTASERPQRGRNAARAGAAFAAALPEAMDVYDVATNKDSTGLDVATQAAEGVSRTAATGLGAAAGAKAGAALGALGGPLAPFTVPIGAAVGGLGGGAFGYWGSGKAIEAGRSALGADTQSPAARLQASQAPQQAPAQQPVQAAQTMAQPAANQIAEQPVADTPGSAPVAPASPAQPLANDITRVGNSFSASGPIGPGYTINGQQQGAVNTMPAQSAQNAQAVQALLNRTPEFTGGSTGYNPAAVSQGQPGGARFTVVGGSAQAERERKQLWNAATTAHKGAQNGQLTASQLNTMRGLMNDERADATSRRNVDANNAASLAREGMSQSGADRRDAGRRQDQSREFAARNSLDERKFAEDQKAQGYSVRAAERMENLLSQYQDATTPEAKSAIAEQISFLRGDRAQNQNLSNNFMKVKVPAMDAEGRMIGEREELVDLRTLGQSQGLQPIGQNPAAMQIKNNTKLSAEEKANQLRALGYQ